MSQFLDMFREQMDIERKYREQIIKLAHAQEVMELLVSGLKIFIGLELTPWQMMY